MEMWTCVRVESESESVPWTGGLRCCELQRQCAQIAGWIWPTWSAIDCVGVEGRGGDGGACRTTEVEVAAQEREKRIRAQTDQPGAFDWLCPALAGSSSRPFCLATLGHFWPPGLPTWSQNLSVSRLCTSQRARKTHSQFRPHEPLRTPSQPPRVQPRNLRNHGLERRVPPGRLTTRLAHLEPSARPVRVGR